MLNTKKLLYILPDLSYVVDLLPTKKEHTFSIQSFRQINGELIKDEEFIPEKIAKLFNKLEEEEYHLVLPDSLFTNTIVNIEEESDAKIAAYIKDKLLPELGISQETHQIATTVLTQFKGTAKVQLSAVEHSAIKPLYDFSTKSGVKIVGLSPLSWTLKSSISLEPSISVLQIGNNIYSALHYIGVDQTNKTSIDDISVISETIKTLKGAEPSIQTIYLLSNSLVEEQLKEQLSDTLPIQQLTVFREEDTKMPSYVKQIIESGMKTLSISDFPVPVFTLEPADEEAMKKTSTKKNDEKKEKEEIETKKEVVEEIELPKPTTPPQKDEVEKNEEKKDQPVAGKETEVKTQDLASQPIESKPVEKPTEEKMPEETPAPTAEPTPVVTTPPVATPAAAVPTITAPTTPSTDTPKVATPQATPTPAAPVVGGVDISKFAQQPAAPTPGVTSAAAPAAKEKKVIKNKSGVSSMLKMVFITLAVFFVTVAVGIGVGMGILSFSEDKSETAAVPAVVQEESTPTAAPESSASATPVPVEEVDAENISILVVNATSKAGYAGTIKALLDDAEVGTVAASNAKGEYEEGTFLLMSEEIPGLVEFVAEATELDVSEGTEDSSVEDTKEAYDAVLVLAE